MTLETKRLGDNTPLSKYVYTLDKVGNRKSVTETQNGQGRSIAYTYDDLYRLTKESIVDTVNGDRTSSYVYDKVGNRLGKTVNGVTTAYVYDGNDRLLNEKVNGTAIVTYGYDNNGSTIAKTENGLTSTYVWNDDKRLVSATVNGKAIGYKYNDQGIRVSSTVDGVETRYLLDEGITANVWEEYSPNVTVQASYVYGYDLISQVRSGGSSFYLVDGLGSTRLLTDGQGQVVNAYGYEAFGETVSQSGTATNSYQYAGEQLDGETGDYYLRQRFYDPSTGRFTRRDEYLGEIQNPNTLHKYMYTNANPITGTDPSGYFTASIGEQASLMQIISSLANMTFQVVSNPVVIQTARNWALLLSAGFASAYLFFKVLEKTKSDGTTDVKIYPDDAPDPQPKNKKKPGPPTPDDKYVNRMRLQIQGGGDFGIGIFNTSDVGVTALQVAAATGELMRRKDASFNWLSNKHLQGAFTSGIAFINEAAMHYTNSYGISEGTQAATYQWDKTDINGKNAVSSIGPLAKNRRKEYRLDLENNFGYNLRPSRPK